MNPFIKNPFKLKLKSSNVFSLLKLILTNMVFKLFHLFVVNIHVTLPKPFWYVEAKVCFSMCVLETLLKFTIHLSFYMNKHISIRMLIVYKMKIHFI